MLFLRVQHNIKFFKNGYKFVLAEKENEYYYISYKGKVIATKSEIPLPCFNKASIKMLRENYAQYDNSENYYLDGVWASIALVNEPKIQEREPKEESSIIPYETDYDEDGNTIYRYNIDDIIVMEITKLLENFYAYDYTYNIAFKMDDKIIHQNKDICLSINSNGKLDTYTNGDIPFYNLDKKIQGLYRIENLKMVSKLLAGVPLSNSTILEIVNAEIIKPITIEGNYCILDAIDDNLIIRAYTEKEEDTKDYIMNAKSGQILLQAKGISAYEQGYIVQKDNDKVVFFDKNIREQISEFDNIKENYIEDGILICEKKKNDNFICEICNLEGMNSTNKKYEQVGKNPPYGEYYSKNYLFTHEYYEYYYGDDE